MAVINKRTKKRVAYQGVEGAYSQLAAETYFGPRVQTLAKSDFPSVFEAVRRRSANFGVVPIENSLAGSIHQNYDLLLRHKVWIRAEVKQRIEHNLVVKPGATLGDLREVYSHPQALAQCEGFLKKMRKVTPVPFFDTAGAAQHVKESERPEMAAIASRRAADRLGLKILQSNIEDNHENFTRFMVIEPLAHQLAKPRNRRRRPPYKTSIVFALKNIPGALYKTLSIFAIQDIDLLKIESRPLTGSPWKYIFYLDLAGDCHDGPISRALEHLQDVATFMKVLGSYPVAP